MSGFAIGLVSAVIGGSIGFITCGLLFASKNSKAEDLKTEEDYKKELIKESIDLNICNTTLSSFAKASPPGQATTARSEGSEYGIIPFPL